MWDESNPPDASGEVAWTDGQLIRLKNEWHRAQRAFAYHPVIGISPLRGDPPYEYQIDYRVRSLLMNESGELQYLDEVSMHLWLPAGFPNQSPIMRPMANIFHPNIVPEGVYFSREWQPTDTLVSYIARVGELLAYRNWDVESVMNPVALEWVAQNAESLPLDAYADFSQFSGGEPLGRIQKLGPATLEQTRRALDDMRFSLLAEEGAPSDEEIAEFSRQTRATVSLFLDNEIPENLRQLATEFDDWCRELPASTSLWTYLRHQRTRAGQAEIAATSMKKSAAEFSAFLAQLESLLKLPAELSPQLAAQLIPSTDKLGPFQLKMPALGRELQKWAADASRLVDEMREAPPQIAIAPEGSLGRRLSAQTEMVKEAVDSATQNAKTALAGVDPILQRAQPEVAALAQVVGWREYVDMFFKARTLEKQVADWGPAGIQAFFLDNAGGSYGPFQFEEPLNLGESRIVVRNGQRGQVEVIDAIGQKAVARGTDGKAIITLKDAGSSTQSTIRITERCEDLIVQISFIQQHTAEALSQLQSPIIGAQSWCGVISTQLSAAQQQQNLRDTHRKATHRWKALVSDLAGLGAFKERLATYHLIQRMLEVVPRITGLIAKSTAKHAAATKTLASIMGKATIDPETDQHVLPPKLVALQTEELNHREDAASEVARLRGLLKRIAQEVSSRLGTPRLCGRSQAPGLRTIGAMPEALVAMSEAMSDDAIKGLAAKLGDQLGLKFSFKQPPAPTAVATAPPNAASGATAARASRPSAPAIPPAIPITPPPMPVPPPPIAPATESD